MIFQKLKKYFNNQESIIFTFIFGSAANGIEGNNYDLDIAVYLKDEMMKMTKTAYGSTCVR